MGPVPRACLSLSVIGGRRDSASASGPVRMNPLARGSFKLIGMGSKVVSLGLEEIRRNASGAEAVVKGEGRRETGGGDTQEDGLAHNTPEGGDAAVDGIREEGVQEEIRKLRIHLVRLCDFTKKDAVEIVFILD